LGATGLDLMPRSSRYAVALSLLIGRCEANFDLYKRSTDDPTFGGALKNFLFDQYVRGQRNAAELIKRGESKTLEFKSTLRWSLKENHRG
jgi:hypothetical protein